MKKTVVCLQCPFACKVDVELSEAGEILSVSGNRCQRGDSYARQEVIAPVRVLTTTVRIDSEDREHPLLSVMTSGAIPKARLGEAMRTLASVRVKAPVEYGEVVYEDLLGTGVNVIATSSIRK